MSSSEQIQIMKYCQILRIKIGNTTEALVESLAKAVYELGQSVGIEMN